MSNNIINNSKKKLVTENSKEKETFIPDLTRSWAEEIEKSLSESIRSKDSPFTHKINNKLEVQKTSVAKKQSKQKIIIKSDNKNLYKILGEETLSKGYNYDNTKQRIIYKSDKPKKY